jgi:hypothetical protein
LGEFFCLTAFPPQRKEQSRRGSVDFFIPVCNQGVQNNADTGASFFPACVLKKNKKEEEKNAPA